MLSNRNSSSPMLVRGLTATVACAALSVIGCATSSDYESPHAGEPIAASARPAEELAVGAPPFTTNETGDDDSVEQQVAEDRGRLDTPHGGDGVASRSEALSTSTGTTFQFTYYVVSQRPKYDPNEVTIRDCAGNFITYASRAWRDDLYIQMTGRFTKSDGTKVVFNDAGGCWKVLGAYYDWGIGVSSPVTGNAYKLRPFRSIAVDRNVLSIGKWYYIKELDGVPMPSPRSSLVHDGCVRAVDVGWAIDGYHIDFFSGLLSAYKTLITSDTTMGGKESVKVYDGSVQCAEHIELGY